MLYQTQRELRAYGIYSDEDIKAFTDEYYKKGRQDDRAMGRMSRILLPVSNRYNRKTQNERYQFRRQVRNLIKWYSYISQILRMFDKELQKEYIFCSYLIGLLPKDPVELIDLEGKLKPEYYKLQKTFQGEIALDVESILPKAFGTAAQDGYMEAQESYQSLFEDTAKYDAIMSALARLCIER